MSPLLPDLEQRSVVELRAHREHIVGYAVVFDVRSRDLGGFVEVVRRRAVDPTGDVVALFNHDPGAVLGRTPATLTLNADARGLAFTLDPAPTQAGRDAFELVKRGDVTGASFGFRTVKDAWSTDGGTTIRELLDIQIAEISLTAFPAYGETSVNIAQRSFAAWQAQRQGRRIDWLKRQEAAR